jgi:ABC-type dipeptide/oligopeptide/nickel transport system ATPase component
VPEGFFAALLESVQLPNGRDFLRQRAGQLSTGQGQRLLIALAIMHKPALLIADEPISALDAITQSSVLRLFQQLNQRDGTAILFISHDLLSIASISHRVEILHEGRIVESGPPGELFRAPKHEFTKRLVDAMPRAPHEDR